MGISAYELPILPLIQKESGLLPFHPIHMKADAVFLDRGRCAIPFKKPVINLSLSLAL